MKIKLVQIDGSMPNLALMKLAHWFRNKGDDVTFTTDINNDGELYDQVFASSIFQFSQERLMKFQLAHPMSIVGGSGTPFNHTVEDLIGREYEYYDYTDYPDVDYSIGFLQRGCRLRCKFCIVPAKEGKPRSASTVGELYRGLPHPRKLHILDNDFFGNPEWRERISEIRDGKFRICLSQGINVRLINEEAAAALATIEYRDTKFKERRLYTAWDNIGDEKIFFKGVDMLEKAGVPPKHLMAYMLIGYDKNETWDRIWERFYKMIDRGIRPYPMVFDRSRKDLKTFQRYAVTGMYRACGWNEFVKYGSRSAESIDSWWQRYPEWLRPKSRRWWDGGLTTKEN
jgi:hypothetical protein